VKVLVSAFACQPGRGSEPGAGWNWSIAASSDNEVWVLTREENRASIEAELEARPVRALRFVYVPERRLSDRGVFPYYFRYYRWQLDALAEARRLDAEIQFDVIHHVTFANVWLPAMTCFVGKPFLLGPVGGGPRIPLRLYRELGVRGASREALREVLRLMSRLNPLTRLCWQRSAMIVVQNQETLDLLPRRHRSRAVIHANASFSEMPATNGRNPAAVTSEATHTAILAGRLLPWKGGTVAIRAITLSPDWSLMIFGSGSDTDRLRSLAARLDVDHRVKCAPRLPQAELWDEMKRADALVLPSLRDDSPLVVAEAQSLGLPVVAFDQGGPSLFAGYPESTVVTVPLGYGDPARALATGLNKTLKCDRRPREAGYSSASIVDFLALAYGAVAGSGRFVSGGDLA
jgi:glycosyltransferase involved in cell wall biosynthesis